MKINNIIPLLFAACSISYGMEGLTIQADYWMEQEIAQSVKQTTNFIDTFLNIYCLSSDKNKNSHLYFLVAKHKQEIKNCEKIQAYLQNDIQMLQSILLIQEGIQTFMEQLYDKTILQTEIISTELIEVYSRSISKKIDAFIAMHHEQKIIAKELSALKIILQNNATQA